MRSVRSNHHAVLCESCNSWWHIKCAGITTSVYHDLMRDQGEPWMCSICQDNTSTFPQASSPTRLGSEPNARLGCGPQARLGSKPHLHPSDSPTRLGSEPHARLGCGPHARLGSEPHLHPSTTQRRRLPCTISFLVINFQSVKNKAAELGVLLELHKPDIIIGTETWLSSDHHSSEYIPAEYDVIRKDRATGFGGVLLAFKNLIVTPLTVPGTSEAIFASVQTKGAKRFIVGSVYRPPDSSEEADTELATQLDSVLSKVGKSPIWFGGDLNLPQADWDTMISNKASQPLMDSISALSLTQVVDFPTRGDNLLDVVLTNRPSLLASCICEPGISDHDIVHAVTQVTPLRPRPVRRKIYLWSKANVNIIASDCSTLSDEITDRYNYQSDVEEIWSTLKHGILHSLEKNVPSKLSSSRHNKPWFTTALKKLTRRKKRAFLKARATRTPRDRLRYRVLMQQSRKACHQARLEHLEEIITEEKPKRLFGYIKSLKTENMGVAPLQTTTGLTSLPKEKANILNAQFTSVFSSMEPPSAESQNNPISNLPQMTDIQINPEGVCSYLSRLKPHCASGPDNIPARFLKMAAAELTPAVSLLFSASLTQGILPQEWGHARVVPVFKKGDRSLPENYRPISLTSILCKALEHIIASNISTHLDNHQLLSDAQHGFRKRRSCTTQLTDLFNDLATNLDDKCQTDMILLDFSKAFDKVSHILLLGKLPHFGLPPSICAWVRSFLADRTQQVVCEGELSTKTNVTSGVPQGSVMGPLLFLLFINDLPASISEGTSVRLFADDSAIYRRITGQEDQLALQRDLSALEAWEARWRMSFHPMKCQVLNITRRKTPMRTDYILRDHILETTKSAKYLGVTLSADLKWSTHINQITKKAERARAFIHRNVRDCTQKAKETCYTAFVRPILEYASEVWDPLTAKDSDSIERVQRRAARSVLSNYSTYSSVSAMLANLRWEPLKQRRTTSKLSLFRRAHLGEVSLKCVTTAINSLQQITKTRGHTLKLRQPSCRTNTLRDSFLPSTIRLWNQFGPA